MPIVPGYDRQVRQTALSAPRVSTDLPDDAFGGGPAAQKAAQAATDFFTDLRKQADEAAFVENDLKASQLQTRIELGLQNYVGKNAADGQDWAQEEWLKGSEDIRGSAANQFQKAAIERALNARAMTLDKTTQVHVAKERKKYDDDTTKSYLSSAMDEAVRNYGDRDRIELSLFQQRSAIDGYATRQGLYGSEQHKQMIRESMSKTHRAVIERMLADGLDLDADNHFKEFEIQIDGDDATAIKRDLLEGSIRGESQRQVSRIMAEKKTWPERMKLAREWEGNPKVKDAIRSRLQDEMNFERAMQNQAEEELYLESTNRIDANPGKAPRSVISPSKWNKLSLEKREALERRAQDVPMDEASLDSWLEFISLSNWHMASMSRADFETKYWSKFDKEHRSRAERRWEEARTNVDKQPQLTSIISPKERIENVARAHGIIPAETDITKMTSAQKREFDRFEAAASAAVEDYEVNNLKGQRRATGEELQKVLDDVVKNKRFVRGTLSNSEVPAAMLKEDQKRRVFVPFDRIPEADRKAIENLLKSRNRRVTNDKIERIAGARQMNDRELVNQIIEE